MVAPLAARGVKVGILMGSAYLFTRGDRRQRCDRPAVPAGSDRLRAHREPRVGAGSRQPLRLHAVRGGVLPHAASSIATTAGARRREPARARRPDPRAPAHRLEGPRAARPECRARGARRRRTARRRHVHAGPGRDAARRRSRDIATLHREVTDDAAALLEARLAERAPVLAAGRARRHRHRRHGRRCRRPNSTATYWAEHPRQGRRDHRDPGAPLGLAPLLRRRPHRQGQDLLEVGRLPRRHAVRSDALRHAAEVDRRRSTRCS